MKIGLLSCVKTKQTKPCKAKDMYISPLFKGMYAYLQNRCDVIYILSAKHGLLETDIIIEPYNKTLNNASKHEQKVWAYNVLKELSKRHDINKDEFIIMGGANYTKYITQKIQNYTLPLKGLSMGNRLKWLKENT